MPILSNDTARFSSVVKYESDPEHAYCRDMVVYNGTAIALPIGTVLGKVTATGKYKINEATAVDGSQVAAAVVIGNSQGFPAITTAVLNTDTQLLALTRGPCIVAAGALSYGASVTAGALRTAAELQLKAAGVIPEITI